LICLLASLYILLREKLTRYVDIQLAKREAFLNKTM
jgi:hypothetical protein